MGGNCPLFSSPHQVHILCSLPFSCFFISFLLVAASGFLGVAVGLGGVTSGTALRGHLYLVGILFFLDCMSFGMTWVRGNGDGGRQGCPHAPIVPLSAL